MAALGWVVTASALTTLFTGKETTVKPIGPLKKEPSLTQRFADANSWMVKTHTQIGNALRERLFPKKETAKRP